MTDDARSTRDLANEADSGGASFLEVLALFLRTIPLYPDGHRRVRGVTEKFRAALAERGSETVVEPTETGLRVDGHERASLATGPAAFREALMRTGVARVTFDAAAPETSYVSFARSLQRNARLRQSGALTFSDLWMAPIEGIRVEEQRFSREDFSGEGGEAAQGRVVGTPGGGDGLGVATSGTAIATEEVAARPTVRAARALREMVLDDVEACERLARVVPALMRRADGPVGDPGVDFLDHLLASLPIEARLDLGRGVEIVRRVLSRLEEIIEGDEEGTSERPAAALLRAVGSVFPDRQLLPDEGALVSAGPMLDPTDVPEEAADALEDVQWMGPGPRADVDAPIDDVDGIVDLDGVLTHVLLDEPAGVRREHLRERLTARLRSRSPLARPPCILVHLREAAHDTSPGRDPSRVRLLAQVVEDGRLDLDAAFPSGLDPDVVVAAFPALLATHLARGGSAGYVARRVGRAAVLAATSTLTAPGGVLRREDLVQKILSEHTRDALPFLEILGADEDAARHKAVIGAMRRTDIPCGAAIALRVATDARLPLSLLRVLCEDGFVGVDSHREDPIAVAEIAAVAEARIPTVDVEARSYATIALGGLQRRLVRPVVDRLLARRLLVFFASPRAVRRAASGVLARWRDEDREAAEAAATTRATISRAPREEAR